MTRTGEYHIALISDTHAWFDCARQFGTEGEQLQPWSAQIHDTVLAELRAARPDMLIHLGDYTCGGGVFQMPEDAFRTTLSRLHDDYSALSIPYYGLPGNHDCFASTLDYGLAESYLGLSPRLGRSLDTPQARIVLLCTQGHSEAQKAAALPDDPVHGWVDGAELARLEESLASAGERPVLIFCHQLLMQWANPHPWQDFYGVKNADAVLEIIARHDNVRAVFQGHAHLYDVQEAAVGGRPIWFIVTPSLIQYPLGWLHLTLKAASLRVAYRPLPLPDLAERSRRSGQGQDWRLADPRWHDFTIAL